MGMTRSCQLGYKRANRGPLSAPEGAHCFMWMTAHMYSFSKSGFASAAMSSKVVAGTEEAVLTLPPD